MKIAYVLCMLILGVIFAVPLVLGVDLVHDSRATAIAARCLLFVIAFGAFHRALQTFKRVPGAA